MAEQSIRSIPSKTNGEIETQFELQRRALMSEIEENLESVLHNINRLNRSLEGVLAVGNELGSVETLWSQFESFMVKSPEAEQEADATKDENSASKDGPNR